MKFKALLLALVATLVVASGAAAKNGGGNGKSHAQTTHSESASQGSKHEAKAHATKAPKSKVKKPKKHEAAAAEETGDEPALADDVELEEPSAQATNPAWTCKALLEGLTFVADFGTNANGANAFGKCVSSVANGDEQEETTEVPAEPGAACEAVAPAAVESTEVKAEDEEGSDTPEVPACQAADGTETTAPPAADATTSTGDTTGTVTETVADTAVPSADDALLAAARAVKAFAASL